MAKPVRTFISESAMYRATGMMLMANGQWLQWSMATNYPGCLLKCKDCSEANLVHKTRAEPKS
eukprot:1161001-Pelagomonas_calceolata.AAC.9